MSEVTGRGKDHLLFIGSSRGTRFVRPNVPETLWWTTAACCASCCHRHFNPANCVVYVLYNKQKSATKVVCGWAFFLLLTFRIHFSFCSHRKDQHHELANQMEQSKRCQSWPTRGLARVGFICFVTFPKTHFSKPLWFHAPLAFPLIDLARG